MKCARQSKLLAAQLACSNGSDLSGVEAAPARMAIAAERRLMKAPLQGDPDFYIALTRAPGNPVLAEIGAQEPDAWIGDLPNHRLVLYMIRGGNPILAGQCVQHCIRIFAASAYAARESVEGSMEAHHNGLRSRGRKGERVYA